MTKEQEKQIKAGVHYGMGYVCGKHNLHIPKKERDRVGKKFVKGLTEQKTMNKTVN